MGCDFGNLTLNRITGYWKYVPTESLVTVLNEGQITTDVFIVMVTDDQGGVGTDNILVTINGVNDDPVIIRFITQNMIEDEDVVLILQS